MVGNDVEEGAFDARLLCVDVEVHVREGLEDLGEQRHLLPGFAVAQLGQLAPRHLSDRASAVVAAVHGLVVADDDLAVGGDVGVGLHVADPGLVYVSEGAHRVLGGLLAAAAVGENDGSLTRGDGHHEQDSCPR